MERNEKFLTMYLLPVPLTTFVPIPFAIEKNPGCSNEVAKGANKALQEIRFLAFLFHVLLFQLSHNYYTRILQRWSCNFNKSFKSSFEIIKVKTFLALAAPFPLSCLLHLKLNCWLIQLTCLQLRKKQHVLRLFFLNYLTNHQNINLIYLF